MDDAQYRRELLTVFNMEHYGPELVKAIEGLYAEVAPLFGEIIDYLQQNTILFCDSRDPITCFIMLFSWHNFALTHTYLRAIMLKDPDIEGARHSLLAHLRNK